MYLIQGCARFPVVDDAVDKSEFRGGAIPEDYRVYI